jgi:glycosyltransferase involved in cell wall biosynthesis
MIRPSSKGLVSAILVTYNRMDLLKKSVEYLQNQTYTNFECIVVNDGGTDGTENFIKTVMKYDKRFKYIKLLTNSKSVSIPRAIGITYSKGEFIAHIDDDVFCLPAKFSLLTNALNINPNALLSYGYRINITPDQLRPTDEDMIHCEIPSPESYKGVVSTPNWDVLNLPGVDGGQYIYRAGVYNYIPLIFSRAACDWATAKAIYRINSSFLFTEQPVCKYLWHKTNRSYQPNGSLKIYPANFKQYFNLDVGFTINFKEI